MAREATLLVPQNAMRNNFPLVRLPDDEESKEEYGDQAGVLYAVANPEIIKHSRGVVEGVEACLSIPGYQGNVDRYDSVVVTGQAAGFLDMMAEGMSCALHSGAIAGESIVESFTRNHDANHVYDDLIQSERKRTVDQWNPVKILFDNPHEADLKAAIMKVPLSDRVYMVKEMLAYIGQFKGYSWVKPILTASVKRLFLGRY